MTEKTMLKVKFWEKYERKFISWLFVWNSLKGLSIGNCYPIANNLWISSEPANRVKHYKPFIDKLINSHKKQIPFSRLMEQLFYMKI